MIYYSHHATKSGSSSLPSFSPILDDPSAGCVDKFSLHKGICGLPTSVEYSRDLIAPLAAPWMLPINETTRKSCQQICTDMYDMSCSSVIYDAETRGCILSSYDGSQPGLPCLSAEDERRFEIYRRNRCVGASMVTS